MSDANLDTYIPDYADLPKETLQNSLQKVAAFAYQAYPDLDTRPGSVFGDLFAIPAAHQCAALEVAAGRMLSDMDISNVAKGVIYNCDFVKAYLESMGAKAGQHTMTTGLVLFKFTSDRQFNIPADTRVRFESEYFSLSYPSTDGFIKVGKSWGQTDCVLRLSALKGGLYGVLLPVVGEGTTVVKDKNTAYTDITGIFPELAEISAVGDFVAGYTPTSLVELAQKLPSTFPAANTSTPAGIVSWVRNNRPDIQRVSVVTAEDVEMTRDIDDTLSGFKLPRVDVYVGGEKVELVEYIRLGASEAITENNHGTIHWRSGPITLQATPAVFTNDLAGNTYCVDWESTTYSVYGLDKVCTDWADGGEADYALSAAVGGYTLGSYVTVISGTPVIYMDTLARKPIVNMQIKAVDVNYADDTVTLELWDQDDNELLDSVSAVISRGALDETSASFSWGTGNAANLGVMAQGGQFVENETWTLVMWAPYIYVPLSYTCDKSPVEVVGVFEQNNLVGSGVDMLVRPFKQLSLSEINILYRKLPGTIVARGELQTAMESYFKTLCSPVMLEASALSDLTLNAGAAGVISVEVKGYKRNHAAAYQLESGSLVAYAPTETTDVYTFSGCKAFEYDLSDVTINLKGI